jgi:prepilin-type N-terminal cleavage/methylation domain-containing protein
MNPPRPFKPQTGFSLIEIAIVLGILGLLFALFAGVSANQISQHRRELTRNRLANIDLALTLFVSQYKRLPCPADGKLASSAANAGQENPLPAPPASQPANCTPGTGTNNQQDGVVPWAALGLTASDIEDGWGGRFTYRVGPDLVVDGAMDFSSCDTTGTKPTVFITPAPYCNPAGTLPSNCNSATYPGNCTPLNTALTGAPGKGLLVKNNNIAPAPPIVIMNPSGSPSNGAAYVVISHGAEGGGAYGGQGVMQLSGTLPGAGESNNFANLAYATPASFLVDDVYNATAADHFDDLVSRPNILTLATKAQLGPRSH